MGERKWLKEKGISDLRYRAPDFDRTSRGRYSTLEVGRGWPLVGAGVGAISKGNEGNTWSLGGREG